MTYSERERAISSRSLRIFLRYACRYTKLLVNARYVMLTVVVRVLACRLHLMRMRMEYLANGDLLFVDICLC